MKVLKFGGTSAGSAARIQKIGEIVENETPAFIVLSAMSGTTNQLVEITNLFRDGKSGQALQRIALLQGHYEKIVNELLGQGDAETVSYVEDIFKQLNDRIEQGNFQPEDEYLILSFGERLSSWFLYKHLVRKGIETVLLDATRLIRLKEDGEVDVEDVREKLSYQLGAHPQASVFVTQGFICSDFQGKIANLGRGGSDYSATLFGAAMEADVIQIWTDIDGVQNNDPRIVSQTRPVRQLHFDEAAELAYFGAKILHPQCVLPAQKKGIPVLLKNTLQPDDPGTTVSESEWGTGFKAVAARDHITAIRIKSSRMLNAYGFLKQVFEIFDHFKTPIDMITTSEVAVSLTIDNTQYLNQIINRLKAFGKVEVEGNKTIVGVVGHIDPDNPGYAMRLFSALSDVPIRMISYGASRHNISFLINTTDKKETLTALHAGLFE